ncbi:MAG: DNA adenine methylase [Ferrovibrio sp.]
MTQHHTPLRYPGGKQRLTPFILELIEANGLTGGNYVEPYAGGAGVAIELLLGKHVKKIHLNDSSVPIHCFWKAIKTENEKFCRRISTASLTIEEWKRQRDILRNISDNYEFDVGFAAFYLNRCNRSGVLTGGVIGSLKQVGKWKIDARFSRNELIRRVEAIGDHANSIALRNMDAEDFIKNYIAKLPKDTFVYCDPPYYEKSRRLYLDYYQQDDHERIAGVIQKHLKHKWVVSYDAANAILKYYKDRKKFLYDLQYAAAKVYKGREVFIFSDRTIIPRTSGLSYINTALRYNPKLFSSKKNSPARLAA